MSAPTIKQKSGKVEKSKLNKWDRVMIQECVYAARSTLNVLSSRYVSRPHSRLRQGEAEDIINGAFITITQLEKLLKSC
jgi:hypothetical protein